MYVKSIPYHLHESMIHEIQDDLLAQIHKYFHMPLRNNLSEILMVEV